MKSKIASKGDNLKQSNASTGHQEIKFHQHCQHLMFVAHSNHCMYKFLQVFFMVVRKLKGLLKMYVDVEISFCVPFNVIL